MKILVCVKVVQGEVNPFDEAALECALTLSDEVTVLTMGPKHCENALLPLTRLGAKAILISDSLYAGSDTLATAYVLSKAIKMQEFDLILCGRQSIDGDTAQVGPMLSQMLGVALITNALHVSLQGAFVSAKTRTGEEKASLPLLITVERGYVLRFPSLFSKLGTVTILDNTTLQCNPLKCGLSGSPTQVIKTFENERGRRKCRFIEPGELYVLLDKCMRTERIIQYNEVLGKKLTCVWAIGHEVLEKAKEIADAVIVIDKTDPHTIAERAQTEKPDVILWNADLWGRRYAPVVAAMLQTGLCADCTRLETDGENLIMYRPAQGGNIIAKIRCMTKPQMATVRTKTESSDILVAGGRGISDAMERLQSFAQRIGGQIGASRGLVDTNALPYAAQIGLTGKTVSPRIYIAIGISGAIQHTCAVEGADTIIAINPDRNARIFDYADYGILAPFADIPL